MKPDESRTAWEGDLLAVTVERWGEHEREVVEHPGAVAMVAVDEEGFVWLVRQLREATRQRLLELPAGTAEAGEDPLATAKRELQEECGLRGGEWHELAVFWTTPGFCRERMHLFAVDGAQRGEASPAEDEELELVRWPVGEIAERLDEIEDAKTLAGLLLYLHTRTHGERSTRDQQPDCHIPVTSPPHPTQKGGAAVPPPSASTLPSDP